MAEQTTIATSADLIARLSTQAYTRLYARDGGSTVNTTFRDLCLAEANSLFRTLTRAAFPSGVYTTTDTLDPAIVGCVVDLCNDIAASRHASYDVENGYAVKGAQARAFCKQINRDADARPAGSSATPARPIAVLNNDADAAGNTTHPYQGIRDGSVGSGF